MSKTRNCTTSASIREWCGYFSGDAKFWRENVNLYMSMFHFRTGTKRRCFYVSLTKTNVKKSGVTELSARNVFFLLGDMVSARVEVSAACFLWVFFFVKAANWRNCAIFPIRPWHCFNAFDNIFLRWELFELCSEVWTLGICFDCFTSIHHCFSPIRLIHFLLQKRTHSHTTWYFAQINLKFRDVIMSH